VTAPALTAEAEPSPKLHQPGRALIAGVELVLVVVLGFAAHWCWQHGIQEFSYPLDGRPPLVSTRYHGNWVALAVVAATVGGILVLDAIRQVILAVRTRDRVVAEVE
jgi:hypothetical protein